MRRKTILWCLLAPFLAAASPTQPGHGGPIRAVAASSGHILSGGFDGAAILWPEATVLRGHDGAVNATALGPDATPITGGADGRVLLWHNGTPQQITTHSAPVAGLAVQGDDIASASWDGTATIWSPNAPPIVLSGHDGPVNAAAFTPDGHLATAGYDGTLRIWQRDGTATIRPLGAPQNAVIATPDGEIATGGADGILHLLTPQATRDLSIDTVPITGLALSSDGASIAVVTLGGAAVVVDRASLRIRTVFLSTEHPLWSVAFDGADVITAGAGQVLRRWDSGTGRMLALIGAPPALPTVQPGNRGAQVFRACSACHALSADAAPRAGPSLHALFGRRIATQPDYAYSPALRAMTLVWTQEAVTDLFDRGPQTVTPGTKMPEQRITDPADRAALIAYLARETLAR